MKILYVTDVFPPQCGGSGWSVYFFARGLRTLGHDVSILALDGKPRTYDDFEVQALNVPHKNWRIMDSWRREHYELPRISEAVRVLLPHYDIVHAHHRSSALAVASNAGNASAPFFVTIRDYWPICFCGKSQFRTGDACDAYDFGRCSSDENTWKGLAAPLVYPWFEARNRRWRELLRDARTLFCISNYIRDQLLPFFPEKQLAVLHNFAEDIPTAIKEILPERFCLYVGRLERNKGVHLLPEILQQSKLKIPTLIAGEGSLRDSLEDEFNSRGVDAHFLEYMEYPRMLTVLKHAEFVLFPSLWAEPLGRVLIEAAMMGKPAIAFNHRGGHHDIMEHNRSGLLVGSKEEFAKAIARLQSQPKLRSSLGTNAKQIYEQRFSPYAVLPKLLEFYEKFE
jgi:glycosyltransferase involved in cell wall biosynthesis